MTSTAAATARDHTPVVAVCPAYAAGDPFLRCTETRHARGPHGIVHVRDLPDRDLWIWLEERAGPWGPGAEDEDEIEYEEAF